MKRWNVIHKIKSMYDGGAGCSIREISRQLGIARNTVLKYSRLSEGEIQARQEHPERTNKLDAIRDYLLDQLRRFPKLSATKLKRKLERVGKTPAVSGRTFRRYVAGLKREVAATTRRRYEPVIGMVPGVQCQVDPGELRDVVVAGVPVAIYLVVFVLAYSRLLYVAISERPVDTAIFLRMHDEAFRYFGGVTEVCVYDQTRLVVLKEEFREVWFNEAFHHYAAAAGFDARVCEGYDPESKGKVEAGVKYVKNDCFYGETFASWDGLTAHVRRWVDEVANLRRHGTTGQSPRDLFAAREQAALKPDLTPRPPVRHFAGHVPQYLQGPARRSA